MPAPFVGTLRIVRPACGRAGNGAAYRVETSSSPDNSEALHHARQRGLSDKRGPGCTERRKCVSMPERVAQHTCGISVTGE